MDDAFFIDKDGNKIYSDTISSHIGLAKLILKNNQQLQEEYEKSNAHDPIDFLVQNKGYLKVSNIRKLLIILQIYLTDKKKFWIIIILKKVLN